jgi:hypothetical protein
MFVEAIFNDAKEVLGMCNETKIFSRLTDAVEALANKGQWDSLLTYLVITTTGDNELIALPTEVDAVLRLNINGTPSFARDRMWEFTLDGPGTTDARLGFQWEDLGDLPQGGYITPDDPNVTESGEGIQQAEAVRPPPGGRPPNPPVAHPHGSYGINFPLNVIMYAREYRRGQTAHIIYTTDGSDPTWTHGTHGGRTVRLTLNNETTLKFVAAVDVHSISSIVEEFYTDTPAPEPPPDPNPPPPPVFPGQRILRISQKAVSVRALVRLKPRTITSQGDWIPLDSKLAILLMLKALESYRRGKPEDFQLGQAQEKQALQFLQEEQSSRNIDGDLAKVFDRPPLVGFTYHSNNVVVVADIYDEAAAISGGIGKTQVLDRISEAIEVLANKGQWDGLTAYLDMVPGSDVIGLPRQVEIPLRINIESRPAISRTRLFEFTTNGPGTDLTEVTTLTWEDQGDGPLMLPITPANPQPISVGGVSADQGKKVTVYGIDVNDTEQVKDYLIPANEALQVSQPVTWKQITRLTKEVTQGPITIFANFQAIAVLYPDETEPKFRIIKLNKRADNIKIMFRKTSLKVTSTDDMIPLKSRSAILTMMRALQILKAPDLQPPMIQASQALETQALKYLQEEEQSRLAFIQASAKDQMPALGSNLNSQGVVTAGDVYDDAAEIFGPIGRQRLFDKITEAMELLANKSQWDGMDGYVDIVTDQRGYVTFPRRVETPVAVNFNRSPAQIRNKWYEFHMNGLGSDPVRGDFLDDLGESPLIIDLEDGPMRLFAQTGLTSDGDTVIRAYGYDNTGEWVRTLEGDKFVDGEIVPVTVVAPNDASTVTVQTTTNEFRQVFRVTKEETDMPVTLFGTASQYAAADYTNPKVSNAPVTPKLLAFYDADETEPMFRRMRVPTYVTWLRMRYRLRTMKITKMSDVLNMRSKTALVTMMRGLKALETDANAYQAQETIAIKLISEEQMSRSPAETFDLQFDQRVCFADPLQGQY